MILPDFYCGFFNSSFFGNIKESPLRTPQIFELEYYTSDAKYTFHNDNAYPIKQYYIHVTKPGDRRYSELPFTSYYIKFPAEGPLRNALEDLPMHFPAQHSKELELIFKAMITETESVNCNYLLLYELFLKLINLIIQDSSSFLLKSKDALHVLSDTKTFIETHYHENITLKDMARAVNLSPSYLHSVFSSYYKITPHEYLINYRISKAKEFLWDTNMSLSYIAETCGFGCQQYMNQIFKKHLNVSPGKYRKENIQKYIL